MSLLPSQDIAQLGVSHIKRRSPSLVGAAIAHAAFILKMNSICVGAIIAIDLLASIAYKRLAIAVDIIA